MLALVVGILASFLVGASSVAWYLQQRWRHEINQASDSLNEMTDQVKAIEEENNLLKQTNADLKYQLGEAQKDIKHLRSLQD